METGKTFGEAIAALKQGKRIARPMWTYDGGLCFVFMQVPATIKSDVVPKMQSLPQSVKDYFESTFNDLDKQIDAIYYDSQLAFVGPSNLIVGYAAQPADILAEDWCILD